MSNFPQLFEDLTTPQSLDNVLVGLSREGCSVKQRKIYISSINSETPLMLSEFLDYIKEYQKDDDKDKPVTLVISTYGGEAYAMFGMVDLIRTSEFKIDTTVIGSAFSAGAWILAAGTGKRRAHEHSHIMVHQLRGDVGGTMQEIDQTTQHHKGMQQKSEDLLARFSHKDKRYWQRVCKKEFYMTPDQALKLGIIDEIIYEKAKNN